MSINSEIEKCIRRATDYLLARQQPDGHWVGEMEGDTILESEYVLLMRILGFHKDPRLKKAAEFIRQKQLDNGGWAIYPGGPAELSASVKAYWAIKLTGTSVDEPYMQKARELILSLGGADLCNSYTMFYLAALGQVDWDRAPAVPPEIVLLPKWFYFNLYEISSWSRTFVVPLSIIWSHRPVIELDPDENISELFTPSASQRQRVPLISWKQFFFTVDRLLKIAEHKGVHPLREKALNAAHEWMLEHFEKSSGLGAIYPPMIYALLALRCLGYPDDHPQVVHARRELENLAIEEEDTLRYQPCESPVWDTAIVVNALACSGAPSASKEITRAANWLIAREIRCKGDWSVKRPDLEPGGWCFEYANDFYPDIDDTAMVLIALKNTVADHDPKCAAAVRRGLNWTLSMQGRDGGWASFDVDNNRKVLCSIPFADHNAMIDPSTADITARVLEMLSMYGYDQSNPEVQRAINYLLNEQEDDGSWFGRWGVNYVYGTFQVLKGLAAIGLSSDHPSIRRGVDWLISCQNADGGWGEGISTYDDPSQRGKGPSTASQTAWAVIGLIAAGYGDTPAVRRGMDFLTSTQNEDGSWDEDEWTGTGFPKVFYLKYHLYRQTFPLWAIGVYNEYLAQKQAGYSTTEYGRATG